MACYREISSVSNTLNKLHIQYYLHAVYKKLYHDKGDKFDELFDQYYIPLLKYIDNPELFKEWKQNLDAADYENNLNKEIKLPSNKKLLIVVVA